MKRRRRYYFFKHLKIRNVMTGLLKSIFVFFSLTVFSCVISAQTRGEDNGHEWVDLGLPSGTKWATCNIGASSPSDNGSTFSWGETRTYRRVYDFSEIKYCSDSDGKTFSKYNTDPSCGPVDNKTVLELSDDAARKRWGGGWRIPTNAECEELARKCKWEWKVYGQWHGYVVTGPNGASIMLPAYIRSSDYYSSFYWTSSLYTDNPVFACVMVVSGNRFSGSTSGSLGREMRIKGCYIRPVLE